jgi:Family of unknown function (DUF6491)
MRLTTIGAALLVAGCASTPTADNTQPAKRACGGVECFYEREVRDFEVINHTTLIVYVGAQRCPYQVELHGTFCDLAFAPEIYFSSPGESARHSGGDDVIPLAGDTSGARHLNDLRICSNDISIGVSGGVFTNNQSNDQGKDVRGGQPSDCQIQSVSSLTDDKLIELYVRKGVVAPPPPVGSGQIQVGASTQQNGAGAQVSGASR